MPNRTFLADLDSISGEYVRAMVCFYANGRRVKPPMARANNPNMPLMKKKVRFRIYRTRLRLSDHVMAAILG